MNIKQINTLKTLLYAFYFLFCVYHISLFAQRTETQIVTVPVVNDHAGGDDEHKNTFVYAPPELWRILSFRPLLHSSYGDATYTPRLVNEHRLEVDWRTKSNTVRGPFNVVIDTKTAHIDLSLEITLIIDLPPHQKTITQTTAIPSATETTTNITATVSTLIPPVSEKDIKEVIVKEAIKTWEIILTGIIVPAVGTIITIFIRRRFKSKEE